MGNAYKALLRDAQARLLHSGRGECYDNAQAESLWARLKTEELEARGWPRQYETKNGAACCCIDCLATGFWSAFRRRKAMPM